MKKKATIALILFLVLCFLGVGLFFYLAEDGDYRVQEAVFAQRYARYDPLIVQASLRYDVPPELVKAVIWRESRFLPDKVGTQGERGLMQIMEPAASEWARAEKIETFAPTDLFDPKVNIEAGTWYLARALRHWSTKDNAIPFALAEYNAGRSRVQRWIKDSGRGNTAGAEDMQLAMDFPLTKSYVTGIVARYAAYKKRGEFPIPSPTTNR